MKQQLTAILFLVSSLAGGQNTFFRTIGGSNSDYGTQIVRTADNGFALTLNTPTNPPLNSLVNVALVKTDENGDMLWAKEYSDGNTCLASRLLATSDEGFLITGVTGDFMNQGGERKIWLLKADFAGNILWTYTYALTGSDRGIDAVELPDGYLIASIGSDNIALESMLLMKIGKNGDVIWEEAYAAPFGECIPYGIAAFSDGNFVVTATVAGNGPGFFLETMLAKFTATGQPVWSKAYGTTYDDTPVGVKVNDIGEIYVCGNSYFVNTEYDIYLLKTDSSGHLANELFFDAGTAQGEQVRDFVFAGGKIGIAADKGSFDARDVFLFKTDVQGSFDFVKQYPFSSQFTNYPYSLIYLPDDNTFAFTGDFRPPSFFRDAGLIKTDREGDAGCYSQEAQLMLTDAHFDSMQYFLTHPDYALVRAAYTDNGLVPDITPKTFCEYILPKAGFDTSATAMDCPSFCAGFTDTSKNEVFEWEWLFPGAVPASFTGQHPQNICFPNSGTYPVTQIVTNQYGSDTAYFDFIVDLDCPVNVPNVFTPNQDGVNDLFSLNGLPQEFTFSIYNRWGMKIFETSDGTVMWNGSVHNTGNAAPEGVYYYLLELPSKDPQSGFLHLFF